MGAGALGQPAGAEWEWGSTCFLTGSSLNPKRFIFLNITFYYGNIWVGGNYLINYICYTHKGFLLLSLTLQQLAVYGQ